MGILFLLLNLSLTFWVAVWNNRMASCFFAFRSTDRESSVTVMNITFSEKRGIFCSFWEGFNMIIDKYQRMTKEVINLRMIRCNNNNKLWSQKPPTWKFQSLSVTFEQFLKWQWWWYSSYSALIIQVFQDYAIELFYRESWRDPRLRYDRKLFKNKTELALHESYTNFLWFVWSQS